MRAFLSFFPLLLSLSIQAASGRGGIAATIHPLATEAAIHTLKNGGNAIDAAVAAAVTLGVVDAHDSGLGGGCFMLIHAADGRNVALDGREMAPAGSSKHMFEKAARDASTTGPLAVGIPGSLAVYDLALREHGKFALGRILRPAADLAEKGFSLDRSFASRLEQTAADLARFPAAKAIFLKPDGSSYKAGEILKQRDLAASYRKIAEQGIDWFYRGEFARAAGRWMEQNGGVIHAKDFEDYRLRKREPLLTEYRGYQIVGFPPPSSGGVHVAQILNILENFELSRYGVGSSPMIHLTTEAMKLAFADRAYWLGDPDFTPVPKGLAGKEYGRELAAEIKLDRASTVRHGTPPHASSDSFGKHTTHFAVADKDGNWVACTATINTSFGSKVVVEGTGILLNNQMDDFVTRPGEPNAFGLVGVGDANTVAPGKRPLSSMSPTIVLKDGRPIFSVGAAGGPTIITQVLLALVNRIDYSMDPPLALKQARFHHQWVPDELRVERAMPAETVQALQQLGHRVEVVSALGAAQAIGWDPVSGLFSGAADPRSLGSALAVEPAR